MGKSAWVRIKKVNVATIQDQYHLLVTNDILESVASKKKYRFFNSFSWATINFSVDLKDKH